MSIRNQTAGPIELRFADGSAARVALHRSPVIGPLVMVDRDGRPIADLTPDAAERIAYALLAAAAEARGLHVAAGYNRHLATADSHAMGRITVPGTQDVPSGAQNARQDAPARHDATVWVPAPCEAVQDEQSEVPR